MKDWEKLLNWQELNLGGVIVSAGNSESYQTGTWRSWRPEWKADSCLNCLTCWVFCPENAFELEDEMQKNGRIRKVIRGIDYYHCKGCGLCVRECPVNRKGEKRALEFRKEEI